MRLEKKSSMVTENTQQKLQTMDSDFLEMYNQKCTLMGINERYITSNDYFSGIFVLCDQCDTA